MKLGTYLRPALILAVTTYLATTLATAQSAPPATNQQQAPGAAYQDGFEHGKADAQKQMPSYGQPGDQWTTDDARSAYSLGYGAGYAQGTSSSDYFGSSTTPSAMAATPQTGDGDAASIGYEDGRAAGRRDLDSGNGFRPADGEMYRNADRGWKADLGDKERYRQLYRESYARGYQEGYGNSPTTY